MHPSKAIHGRKSQLLSGKKVVLGISGSIAAVEVVRLIRELIRHGAEVIPVMTSDASTMVTPASVEFASGRAPIIDITGQVEHVELFGPGESRAHLLLLAPATANTISKVATGVSDTSVTTCASMAIGAGIPVMIAPTMHGGMTQNPFIIENLKRLERVGVTIIPSTLEEGEAKLPPPELVAAHVLHRLADGPLSGRGVVVIGGSTAVPIDAVRHITNAGSGRSAVGLATSAYWRGASVTLWMGESRVPIPEFLGVERFRTPADLVKLVRGNQPLLRKASIVIVPAAISDYAVEGQGGKKIDSEAHERLTLNLTRIPKLLPLLREVAPPPVRLIGYKLAVGEGYGDLVKKARKLLAAHKLDAVVANDVAAMGAAEAEVHLVGLGRKPTTLQGKKEEIASKLMDILGGMIA